VYDWNDTFPNNPREYMDTDSDGIGDNLDPDADNDGIPDMYDDFPENPMEWTDTDGES